MALPCGSPALKSFHSFSKYHVHKFGNRQTARMDEQTDGSMDEQTGKNIIHPAVFFLSGFGI